MIWLMENLKISSRTDCGKLLCYQAFNITKNPKCDRYQTDFAVVAYKILDKVW